MSGMWIAWNPEEPTSAGRGASSSDHTEDQIKEDRHKKHRSRRHRPHAGDWRNTHNPPESQLQSGSVTPINESGPSSSTHAQHDTKPARQAPDIRPRHCQPLLCTTCPSEGPAHFSPKRTSLDEHGLVSTFSTEDYPHLRVAQAFGEEPAGYPLTYLQCPLDIPKKNCSKCGGYHPRVHVWEILVSVESVHEATIFNSSATGYRFNKTFPANQTSFANAAGQKIPSANPISPPAANERYHSSGQKLVVHHTVKPLQDDKQTVVTDISKNQPPNLAASFPRKPRFDGGLLNFMSTSFVPSTSSISGRSSKRLADILLTPHPLSALLADSEPDFPPNSLTRTPATTNPPTTTTVPPTKASFSSFSISRSLIRTTEDGIRLCYQLDATLQQPPAVSIAPEISTRASVAVYFARNSHLSTAFELAPDSENFESSEATQLQAVIFSVNAFSDGIRGALISRQKMEKAEAKEERRKERRTRRKGEMGPYVPEPIGTGRYGKGKGKEKEVIEEVEEEGSRKDDNEKTGGKGAGDITSVPVDTSLLYVTSIVLKTTSQCVYYGVTRRVEGWKVKGWKDTQGRPVPNATLWEELDRGIDWLASNGIRVRLWLVQRGENRAANSLAYRALHGDGQSKDAYDLGEELKGMKMG